jgi:hypothetical protein
MLEQQTTSNVLMIRPVGFAANEQTAASNRFQKNATGIENAARRAQLEFDTLVLTLQTAGVNVHIFESPAKPHTPDAVFPNNWVSFHAHGTAVLYPMLAQNRRLERRQDILDTLVRDHRFRLGSVIDLTHFEKENYFLEGTGSLVLDRVSHIAYACLSPRTHAAALAEFSKKLNYEIVAFEAVDSSGIPIYHTNVLLSVGRNFAAICLQAILPQYRHKVCETLESTGHSLVELTQEQVSSFAGNMLELSTKDGGHIIALSKQAERALASHQCQQLVGLAGPLVTADIATIETLGGGSVRCMIAEIHLPFPANT